MKNNSNPPQFILWYYWLIYIILASGFAILIGIFSSLGLSTIIALIAIFIALFYITKNPFTGLLLIIFFLPYERIPTLDISGFTLKLNHFLGIITLISWILFVLYKKQKFEHNFLAWPLIIFIGTLFISALYSQYLPRSMIIFILILYVIFLSVMTVNLLTNKYRLNLIIKIIFWSTLLVCFFGFWQFFGDLIGFPQSFTGLKEGYTKAVFGFPRIQAFSAEPLYLGNLLFIPLGIFISLFLRKIKVGKISRGWQFILIALMLITLVLTLSRGAYLGLAVLLAVIFIFYARYWFSWKVILAIIIAAIIAVAGTYYSVSQGEPTALEKFVEHATVGDLRAGESVQGRLTEYDLALDYWREYPITGIGLGAYGIVKKGFPDPEEMPDWDIVNNQYIELLAETGILGLGAFILIIITLVWRSIIAFYKSRDPLIRSVLVGLLAAFIATMVQYNFFSTLYIMHIWVLIGLLVAVQNMAFKKTTQTEKHEKN